ncbi:MAG TPA: BrnT family toxin [Candidatus Tectomicrobia bacterium]
MTDDLSQCRGFQWDEGNAEKNWVQHQVPQGEAEQVFFNRPLVVVAGEQRTEFTPRYYALGQTDARRLLFIVCTIRNDLIRVLSARPMSQREPRVYEHAKEAAAETDSTV